MSRIYKKLFLITSRARRIIEKTFGILVSCFRIFRREIIGSVDNVKFICKATLALHNFLMKMETSTDNYTYCPFEFVDMEDRAVTIPGQWRSEATGIQGLVPVMSQ